VLLDIVGPGIRSSRTDKGQKMALRSMTGYARSEGHDEAYSWTWEAKSVNSKGLDVRCRLPGGFDSLEPAVRTRAARRFARGNLSLSLSIRCLEGSADYSINKGLLEQVMSILPDIEKRLDDPRPASAEGLLAIRGMVEQVEDTLSGDSRDNLDGALLDSLDQVFGSLEGMREEEGGRVGSVLTAQLGELDTLIDNAANSAAAQPGAIKARLREQLAELRDVVDDIPEDRLAQEAAILVTKADVTEEIDRLKVHREAATELIDGGGVVGRKLDFLCQELNREANTLCSKSSDVELTAIGIELKATIEQFREQVQNIE